MAKYLAMLEDLKARNAALRQQASSFTAAFCSPWPFEQLASSQAAERGIFIADLPPINADDFTLPDQYVGSLATPGGSDES